MAKKSKKGSWVVTLKRTVTVEIVCDDCTREQAETQPWKYADGHHVQEIDCNDEEVIDVEANE